MAGPTGPKGCTSQHDHCVSKRACAFDQPRSASESPRGLRLYSAITQCSRVWGACFRLVGVAVGAGNSYE